MSARSSVSSKKGSRSKSPANHRQSNINQPKSNQSKSQCYRNKIKNNPTSNTVAKGKEDSHKKHSKVNCINKAINGTVKEFETLCHLQKTILVQNAKDI